MTDDMAFTDFDQHMIMSLEFLHEVRRRLIAIGGRFITEWLSCSEEEPPFFEIHEWDLGNGQILTQRVLVLDSQHICPYGDGESFLGED